jgi:hypothetical protein
MTQRRWRQIGPKPLLAVAFLLMSLGMPWVFVQGTASSYIPGWYVPGGCVNVTSWDGWMSTECSPGTLSPGFLLPGTVGSTGSGAEHSARFGIVWALVMIAAASLTGRRKLFLYGAAGLAFVAGLSGGFSGVTVGMSTAWIAVGLLVWAGKDRRPLSFKGQVSPV